MLIPTRLRHGVLYVGMALCGLTPVQAQDQGNRATQVCGEIKDEGVRATAELCAAHIGCRLTLSAQKTCPNTMEFLDRLKASIGEGEQGLFGKRKIVQPEYVVEAALDGEARRVAGEPDWKRSHEAMNEMTRKASRSELTGANRSTSLTWAYVGDTGNGEPNGVGTVFFDSGEILRGQFVGGEIRGQGDHLSANGMRRMGEMRSRKLNGEGLAITPTGLELKGNFVDGELGSQGKIKLKDGSRLEGQFQNGALMQGSIYRPDGIESTRGRFDGKGGLLVGSMFDEKGQLVATVDKPAELAKAEAVRQQASEEQRRLTEQQKLRAEQAEAADFQKKLTTLNPGALFALADEMATAGNAAKAREARRTLIARFPNHALAATAAQQMAGGSAEMRPNAGAAQTGSGTTSAGGTAQPTGGGCSPDLSLIPAYVKAQGDWARENGGILRPITTEGAIKYYEEYYKVNVSQVSTERLKEWLAEAEKQYANYRPDDRSSTSRVKSYAEHQISRKLGQCELQRRGAASSTPASITSSGSSEGTGCASTPQESFRRFDRELGAYGQQFPNQANRGGARDQNQYALFYGSKGLEILERYRSCLSAADYAANKKALEGMRETGRIGCEKLSTSPNTCTATYPANWAAR